MLEVLLFVVMMGLILAIIGAMKWNYNRVQRGEAVKSSGKGSTDVMSRDERAAPEDTASSLQTRHQTGQDQTEDPKVRRARLLDTYRVLRKLGMNRDDARALLKPWGIPLDNNLWADAAPPPPEEPQAVTPIAGRPTSAKFHDDPELEYHPLR